MSKKFMQKLSLIFISLIIFFSNATIAQVQDSALDPKMRKEIISDLAGKLTSDYAIAETGSKMASALQAKLESGAYSKLTSAFEFATVLTENLYAVAKDRHLRVLYSDKPVMQVPEGPPPPDVIEQMKKMNGAIVKAEILDGNIGYMRINAVPMFDVSKDAISAAFAFLHNTDALILDNRGNGGGDPKTVAWYMSYLSEGKSYLVNTFHYRKDNRVEEFWTTYLGDLSYGVKKPVFTLSSPRTFSGGEELCYDIQAFKRGLVVGEVTGGGANPGGLVQLVHQFQVFIPVGRAVNPVTKSNWEGVGVKPDVEVQPEMALIEAHSLAIAQLKKDAYDPRVSASLEAFAIKLDLKKSAAKGNVIELKQMQLTGSYAAITAPVPPLTIKLKNGELFNEVPGSPEVKLLPVGINRYKLEGMPDGFFMTFFEKDKKIHLLLEQPQRPMLLEKK